MLKCSTTHLKHVWRISKAFRNMIGLSLNLCKRAQKRTARSSTHPHSHTCNPSFLDVFKFSSVKVVILKEKNMELAQYFFKKFSSFEGAEKVTFCFSCFYYPCVISHLVLPCANLTMLVVWSFNYKKTITLTAFNLGFITVLQVFSLKLVWH